MKTLCTLCKTGLILIPLALVPACKGLNVKDIKKDEPTVTLLISHYKVECPSEQKRDLCLQIKTKGSSKNWEKYGGDIKNFTYKWGYNYEIKATYEDISPKPTDAPSRKYTLKKKISETKVPETSLFVLTVSRDNDNKTTAKAIKKSTKDSTIYKIYDEVEVKCDTNECKSIESAITKNDAIKFILSHDTSLSNRLNISSIACTSARTSFKENCK